jgi:hypothetical protein
MLLSGFLIQIGEFASIIDNPSAEIYLIPENPVIAEEFAEIEQRLLDNGISDYVQMKDKIVDIQIDQEEVSIHVMQTDLLRLKSWGWIDTGLQELSATIFISPQMETEFPSVEIALGAPISIETYIPISDVSADILIDLTYSTLSFSETSKIVVRVFQIAEIEDLEKIADEFSMTLISKDPSNRFLEITADQITTILFWLQLILSSLLIIAISYVMVTLVMESSEDLRVLHMLGYGRLRIFMLLMGQTLLVTLVSILISMLSSILLLSAVLPLITFANLPYSLIFVDRGFVALTSFQAILVGITAGIYPSKLGADFYG